jgi:hypothetical protein
MSVNDINTDHSYDEDDPLVSRLRNLHWAEVDPDVRERCWRRIQSRMSEIEAQQEAERAKDGVNVGERYAFSRFSPARARTLPAVPRTGATASYS